MAPPDPPRRPARLHPAAFVHAQAELGAGVTVWQGAQIREGARIGEDTIVGMGSYVDVGVVLGARCKLQNHVCTYAGLVVEDGVFLGPAAVFTNDLYPRAIDVDGKLKGSDDWTVTETRVRQGASVGANATVVCGVTLGEFCMVAAGSVVTRSVPAQALVRGNPARVVGFVGKSGRPLRELRAEGAEVVLSCAETGESLRMSRSAYEEALR